jgi:hypothetical protein
MVGTTSDLEGELGRWLRHVELAGGIVEEHTPHLRAEYAQRPVSSMRFSFARGGPPRPSEQFYTDSAAPPGLRCSAHRGCVELRDL